MPRVRRTLIVVSLLMGAAARAPGASAPAPPTPGVAGGRRVVSNVAIAPDGRLFVNDKDSGRILIVRGGEVLPEPFATVPVMLTAIETGLLGIAIGPDFADEPWVYVYYSADTGMNTLARIRADGDVGRPPEVLLTALPTTYGYHNGGDLAFGADGMLYLTVGEAHQGERAQDPTDLGGKILRLRPDGSIPDDNPTPGSAVFSSGHRNSFGLCVDPATGDLWETENGPDRDDEINRIRAGGNYGWPDLTGAPGAPGFIDAAVTYEQVIAPTGCAVSADGAVLFFGDYGGRLHAVDLSEGTATERGVIATFDAGVTDVARMDDGSLIVAAGDALYRLRDVEGSPAMPTPASGGGIAGFAILAALAAGLLWQVRRIRGARIGA